MMLTKPVPRLNQPAVVQENEPETPIKKLDPKSVTYSYFLLALFEYAAGVVP